MNSLTQVINGHAAFARVLDSIPPVVAAGDAAVGELAVPANPAGSSSPTGTSRSNSFAASTRCRCCLPRSPRCAGRSANCSFPLLLVLGLFTRFGALGLFAVNALAVISYWHVLGGEGYEAALAQHVLWGYMLAVIAVCGAGALSLDEKLGRR